MMARIAGGSVGRRCARKCYVSGVAKDGLWSVKSSRVAHKNRHYILRRKSYVVVSKVKKKIGIGVV